MQTRRQKVQVCKTLRYLLLQFPVKTGAWHMFTIELPIIYLFPVAAGLRMLIRWEVHGKQPLRRLGP